jgi:hypothetical protein
VRDGVEEDSLVRVERPALRREPVVPRLGRDEHVETRFDDFGVRITG